MKKYRILINKEYNFTIEGELSGLTYINQGNSNMKLLILIRNVVSFNVGAVFCKFVRYDEDHNQVVIEIPVEGYFLNIEGENETTNKFQGE